MQKSSEEIRYFLFSQAVADGLRATAVILVPALTGYFTGHFTTGLAVSLGAMCVSLTDMPGPVLHKRNGMLFCACFAFFTAVLTGYARVSPYTMGLAIALVTFFFSMFNVYGGRASAVGNAAILIMILTMDEPIPADRIWIHALLLLGGGLFYMAISLLLYTLQPYRNAQRALGDCVRSIADYLSVRSDFYNIHTDLQADYTNLIARQVIVNEKQDAVRELFFKTRQIVQESTTTSRRLIFTFVETVDLFENITASYYDYQLLRSQYGHTGALERIHAALQKIVNELDRIGMAIQSNTGFSKGFDYDAELRTLKASVDAIVAEHAVNGLVLRKIIVNVRILLQHMDNMQLYFEKDAPLKKSNVDHSHFIGHQSLDPRILWNNLTLDSSIFRHALRVSFACIVGFIISKTFHYGQHSYWILLTIAFILKPAFSLTKQRNIERIIGTLAGGLVGVLVLVFIPDRTVHFVMMVLFMAGTYTFMRIRYLLMVIFTTPYVLILFSFLGAGFADVAQERIIDTVIGCAIAFSVSYFLFPIWESEQLRQYMRDITKANAGYLQKIVQALWGQPVDTIGYKLARKEVYLHSANLSAAFQRMLSEPKHKQGPQSGVHQFVVMSHILFSNIASVATALLSKEPRLYPATLRHTARKSYQRLSDACTVLGGESLPPAGEPTVKEERELSADEALMKEQLLFIHSVCSDLEKITRSFVK